jgi:hypothetical protein
MTGGYDRSARFAQKTHGREFGYAQASRARWCTPNSTRVDLEAWETTERAVSDLNLKEIRDALSDHSIPLSEVLLKAKVLASILGARELRQYVDRELKSYGDDPVPPYRQIPIGSMGTFVNPPRFRPVENHPIPTSALPKELRGWAETYDCADGIGSIEHLIKTATEHMIWMPWPHENVEAIPMVSIGGFGFRCTEASRCFSTDRLVGILDNVRNRVLDIVLDLAEAFPDQSNSEEQLARLPSSQVLTIIHNHIQGDYATVAAGAVVHQQSAIQVNAYDLDALMSELARLGVSDADRQELNDAITKEQHDPKAKKLAPRISAWVGNLATKAAEKSVEIGAESALPLIIAAVKAYFGL